MKQFTAETWPSGRWPNFSFSEMACSHSGECWLDEPFMDRLQRARKRAGRAFRVTSGYRSPQHPVEAVKPKPGSHSKGQAVDIACAGGGERFTILEALIWAGMTGIGVDKEFLHGDDLLPVEGEILRPACWTY